MTLLLVIEDEVALREELVDHLRFEGFEVLSASDGAEGLQVARDNLPDLIICDILLPLVEGHDVLKELRNDSATAVIPFIFLTAKAEPGDIRLGMELGADDYITKPFRFNHLRAAIQARLEKRARLEAQYLGNYARRLLVAQDNLHRDLAYHLHQDIGEPLASLRMLLGMVKQLPPDASYRLIAEAQTMLAQLMDRLDSTLLDLWPTALDHLGLLPALLWVFERFTAQTQIQVHLQHNGLDSPLSMAVKFNIYQIIREALQNVAAHAKTQEVFVTIWTEEGRLHAQIEDKGAGFDVETQLRMGVSIGLVGMIERTHTLGGQLTIVSTPGQGTSLRLWLPIDAEGQPLPAGKTPPERITTEARVQPPAERLRPSLQPTPLVIGDTSHAGHITVVLADENDLIRQGLRRLLQVDPSFAVVGEAGTAQAALESVRRLKPDVLILDLTMPDSNALAITREVSERSPDTHVLLLSAHAEDVYAWEALQYGATGCILKKSCTEELAKAVQDVAQGKRYISAQLSGYATDTYINARTRHPEALDSFQTLTERETEIFQLVVEGRKNIEIAHRLTISVRTAETHRANMMRKLGVRDRADLLRYAMKRGLVSLEDE